MTSPPRRIVHLLATAHGAPWLISLAREQRRRGDHVHVILTDVDGQVGTRLTEAGIEFSAARMAFPGRHAVLPQVRQLADRLRALKPDVVVSHLFGANILGRLAAWLADVPLRYSMSPSPYCLETPAFAPIEIGTAWADTKLLATCEKTRQLYLAAGVPSDRVDLTYYGSDDATFDPALADRARGRRALGVKDTDPVIALIAYFYPRTTVRGFCPPAVLGRSLKGHDIAISAMRSVRAAVPDAKLICVGPAYGPGARVHLSEMRLPPEWDWLMPLSLPASADVRTCWRRPTGHPHSRSENVGASKR